LSWPLAISSGRRRRDGFIETLKKVGLHFRNDMETGPGGKQIQIEDPDGNPIDLFEPAR
jgi:glyoxylase I family protein